MRTIRQRAGSPRCRLRREDGGPAPGRRVGSGRLLDVSLALALGLVAAPLFTLVMIAIKLDSPGPIFYRCLRHGRDGRLFEMVKFRKMRNGAAGPPLTRSEDERFTRVGRWLAATKLDELPQLWNVLVGDMSFVGPRPEDPYFVGLHRGDYDSILRVRPGITGLSQLAFAKESSILGAEDPVAFYLDRLLPQKLHIDRLYAARKSLVVDLRILVWTVLAVCIRQDVAVDRRTGRLSLRRRPAAAAVGSRDAGRREPRERQVEPLPAGNRALVRP